MIVAGTNFALFWYAAIGSPRRLTENREFRAYLLAMGGVGLLLAALLYTGVGLAELPANVPTIPGDAEHSLRQAVFQTVAIVTTTGYASMDFNTWSEAAQLVLLFAMFLGGSAGSAAGSVKIIRWYIVARSVSRELFTTVHPEAVRPIRMADTVIEEGTVRSVFDFVLLFVALFVGSTVLLYLDAVRVGLDVTALEATSFTIATLGNVGPGFGLTGPMNNFLPLSDASKLYMVFLMWIGRLEIISVLVVFTPAYWRR
jgi:trk system potassium uptake protein TrkH